VSPRLTSRAKGPQLPAKQTTVFHLRRYSFVGGAATLLLVLLSWMAVRAVEPVRSQSRVPLMVQPPMPMIGVDPSLIPLAKATSPPAAVEGTVVSTPSKTAARRTPSKAAPKPTAKSTTKPTPRRTTPPPTPATAFTGRYTTGASWDRGFIGNVDVTNKTGPARTWTVRLTFDPSAGVGVGNTWNAQLSRQGNTFVLTGGPLAPGSKVSLGFEASKQVRGKIQPATCTVDGAPCQLG
jgi:hypothetical protein